MQQISLMGPAPKPAARALGLAGRLWQRVAVLATALLSAGAAQAQTVASYSFSQSVGTYTPITGGTLVATASSTGDDLDASVYLNQPIGFPFRFGGANYTTFSLSTNGFITFGATPPSEFDAPISSTTAYDGAVAPLGTDLVGNTTTATGSPGQLRLQTLGSAPNRILVVQFSNFQPFGSSASLLNFQVRLEENGNVVRLAYGPFQTQAGLNVQAEVGLRGSNNTVFNNRTTATDWTQTTPGTTATATMRLSNAVKPPLGLVYSFTPPNNCPSPQQLNVRNITDSGAELTFAAASPAPSGAYTVTTSPATTTQTVTASPVTLSGLTAGTTYTATVVSNCNGNQTSVPVTVTFTTVASCTAPTAVAVSGAAISTADVSFTPGNGNTSFVVTATPATGGSAVTASGTASPLTLTGLTGGTRYNVTVTGNCSGGGAVTSAPAASFVTLPANDDPAGALALTVGATCTLTNAANVGATTTAPNGYANPGTCGTAANPQDVWFRFTTPASGAAANAVRVAVNGTAAGTVRVFATSGGANGPFTQVACAAGSTNNTQAAAFDATGLTPGTTYYISVAGYGSSDAEGTFGICLTGPASCAAPTNVAVSSVTTNSASISFSAATGATSYTLTYAAAASNPQTVSGSGSPIALTGLAPSTSYTVTVSSNCGGQSATSTPQSFTTAATGTSDLLVPSGQTILTSGTYNNIVVQNNGTLVLTGPTVANISVSVMGVLNTACQTLSGNGSFTLNSMGELRICDPAGIAASGPTGAVRLSGPRSFSPDAAYVYNGTVAQATGSGLPATVRSLTVSNAAGLTLSQALSIRELARLQLGNLSTGGRTFTLLSAVGQGTAVLDNTGGVVSGAGTLQRAIDNNNAAGIGYRHYASPVSSTTVADLAATGFAPVLNPAYNASPAASRITPFPTVFGYDQSRVAAAASDFAGFDKGWFSPAAPTDALLPNRGYTANVANGVLVDFVGSFNNGPQTSGALIRDAGPDAGWHLLGNPYPAPLDWSTVTTAQRPGLDAALYVFQSTGQYAGTYRTFLPGVSNPATVSPLVAAGQGYFVRVSSPGTPGAVALTNANRVTTFGPQPAFGRGAALPGLLQLQVSSDAQADDAFLYFAAAAHTGFNAQEDAAKMHNASGLSLASLAGAEALAINGLPLPTAAGLRVPLRLAVPAAGTYTFRPLALPTLPAGTQLYLLDTQTGAQTLLTDQAIYTTSVAAGSSTGRFVLLARPSGALATVSGFAASQVSVFPNPARGRFTLLLPAIAGQSAVRATLLNALGQAVQTRTIALGAAGATAEYSTTGLAPGVYLLRLDAGGPAVVRRVVVE